MSTKAAAAKPAKVPRQLEFYEQLEENNRFLRRFAAAAAGWAFVALAVSSYAVLVALYRPLAFHVATDGAASFVGRLKELSEPTDPEVRYVAKEFVGRYITYNSLTVERDLADAFNLMTVELQKEQQAQFLQQYDKDHGEEFVAYIEKLGIQTVIAVDDKRTEVTEHNGKVWTVHLRGTSRTWPLNRTGENAAFFEREFNAFVTLVRCPRTEQTPNGLLVAKFSNRFDIVDKQELAPPSQAASSRKDR